MKKEINFPSEIKSFNKTIVESNEKPKILTSLTEHIKDYIEKRISKSDFKNDKIRKNEFIIECKIACKLAVKAIQEAKNHKGTGCFTKKDYYGKLQDEEAIRLYHILIGLPDPKDKDNKKCKQAAKNLDMLCKHNNTIVPNRKLSFWGTNYTAHAEKFRQFIDNIPIEKLTNAESNALYNETRSPINKLPDEILMRVFTFFKTRNELSLAGSVCKRFQSIITDPQLTKLFPTFDFSRIVKRTDVKAIQLTAMAISANRLVAISHNHGQIKFYSSDGNFLMKLEAPHETNYVSLAFTKDEQYIIAINKLGSIDKWSIREKELIFSRKCGGEFSCDSKVIIYSNEEMVISNHITTPIVLPSYGLAIYSTKTGERLKTLVKYLNVKSISLSYDEKNLVVLMGNRDEDSSLVHIFDMETCEVIDRKNLYEFGDYAELSQNNKKVFVCDCDSKVLITNVGDLSLGKILHPPKPNSIYSPSICKFSISRDGDYLAIPEYDNKIVSIWHIPTEECIQRIKCEGYAVYAHFTLHDQELIIATPDSFSICKFPLLTPESYKYQKPLPQLIEDD
jgi:WD40 repeat protein